MKEFMFEIPVIGDILEFVDDFGEPAAAVVGAEATNAAAEGGYEALRESMAWTEVPGTGMDTRDHLLEISQSPEGTWTDPHTGFTSTDPSDFHIDHRVPFSEIAARYPEIYNLPRDEQLAIYNDPDNLQVTHAEHNLEKGSQTAAEHAGSFQDGEARDAFVEKVRAYIRKMDARFG